MKILCTGDKGFIGSNLIPLLNKHEVIGWDLKDGRNIFDFSFEDTVMNCDLVIHLAAETNVTKSFKVADQHFFTNTLGTARVLELVMEYGKRLIYPSTGAYYIPETSPYAKSKKLADDLCQEAMKYAPVTILRFFNIYGKKMNENSGSILYSFLKESKQGFIKVYGKGESKRDFINVEDVVNIYKAAIDKRWIGQIVDVGTGKGHSIKKVAQIFAENTNSVVDYDITKKEIIWKLADTRKLKKLYKKKFKTSVEKDFKELINNYYA